MQARIQSAKKGGGLRYEIGYCDVIITITRLHAMANI